MCVKSAFRFHLVVIALALAAAGPAIAGAPGNKGTATSGPSVPLSAEQLRAIAAKGVPVAPAVPADVAQPAGGRPAGKAQPIVATGARSSGEQVARSMRVADGSPPIEKEFRHWPQVSPALGPVPRPEWSVPGAPRKQPDFAVIGSQRVIVRGATVVEAAGAAGEKQP